MIIKNLEITRGDDVSFCLALQDFEPNTLSAAYFSVKEKIDDNNYIIQKALNSGITINSDNDIQVTIAAADTDNIELGTYYYDLQVTINSTKQTILKGKFNVTYDITRV